MGRCTYLTVDYGRGVKKNEVHDYSREACHAGKGVNLPRTKLSSSTAQMERENKARYYRPRWSTGRDDALG